MKKPIILLFIVFAQFMGTSLWFAGNAIVDDLILGLGFSENSIGHLTSAIQFGFILGTLAFAFFNVADKYSPSKVFMVSAIIGALFNLGLIIPGINISFALGSRVATGFFLAGIYPVGMKIAADHFDKDLGKSLGFLVGALVLGTAFPHFMKSNFDNFPYSYVILSTSGLAALGGLLIFLFVPDGPFRKPIAKLQFEKSFLSFKIHSFRSAAFGYFGHMWELYTFYAFAPLMIQYFNNQSSNHLNISLWSFIFIGLGGLGCFTSGILSLRFGPKRIASWALAISGLMCIGSIFFLQSQSSFLFILFMSIWGFAVVSDSPLFSTLVANNSIPELKGSSLTIVNSIGFAITIPSIQLINTLNGQMNFRFLFLFLVIGPIFGLFSLWKKEKS